MTTAVHGNYEASNSLKIIRLPVVQNRTGLSRSAIYLKISKGEFPSSISLGVRAVGWLEEDVSNWIRKQIQKGEQINANEI
ncbi:AlpA family transcriptional regulator [uncultured Legionella sp.]|uniref:helix-turn-helix transcriptional regulator n=1 Tax=uncultured Legionella sp. TaxID=210934 RepID=UPI002611D810|nr:AlpA family transcriptional regulator [uncultured Legionella sp.]